jgi:hypothetical protein
MDRAAGAADMTRHVFAFALLAISGCHATVRPVVGAEAISGESYQEPCNPQSFEQRDSGLILGATGVAMVGTAALVGANWIGSSQRRADARKPLTAVALGGLGFVAVGGVLVYDDDSPHGVCEPAAPAGEQRP